MTLFAPATYSGKIIPLGDIGANDPDGDFFASLDNFTGRELTITAGIEHLIGSNPNSGLNHDNPNFNEALFEFTVSGPTLQITTPFPQYLCAGESLTLSLDAADPDQPIISLTGTFLSYILSGPGADLNNPVSSGENPEITFTESGTYRIQIHHIINNQIRSIVTSGEIFVNQIELNASSPFVGVLDGDPNSDAHFLPMTFKIPNAIGATAKFKFTKDTPQGGDVRLWSCNDASDLQTGNNSCLEILFSESSAPRWYDASDWVNSSPDGENTIFTIYATGQSPGSANITLEMDPDGNEQSDDSCTDQIELTSTKVELEIKRLNGMTVDEVKEHTEGSIVNIFDPFRDDTGEIPDPPNTTVFVFS